jgi:hypothetical protein
MDLVGAWLRQLLKAGTAATLVPAAMIAALVVVLVGAGGFGGLSAIGQVLTGPQVSRAEQLAARDGGGGGDVAPLAPADAPARSAPDVPRASGRSGARLPAREAQRPRRPAVEPSDPPTVRVPPAPVLTAPAPPPPPAAAAPTRRPTLKQRVQALGSKLKETVEDVGTTVREVVTALGETVERIIDPPPRLVR